MELATRFLWGCEVGLPLCVDFLRIKLGQSRSPRLNAASAVYQIALRTRLATSLRLTEYGSMNVYRRNPIVEAHALNQILAEKGKYPGRVLVIAHRGASAEAPENTLPALELAIDIGADAVEFDVRTTFDRKLVLMHDESVDRTTNGRGKVGSLTLKVVSKLDAGSWLSSQYNGVRVPTLFEALETVRDRIVPVIEIKDDFNEASTVGKTVATALRDMGLSREAVIIARDTRHFTKIRSIAPEIAIAPVTIFQKETKLACAEDPDGLFAFWASLDSAFVKSEHAKGRFVAAWTLNTSHMKTVAGYGTDAIVTNDPRRALEIVV